jgi:hypothetical protein
VGKPPASISELRTYQVVSAPDYSMLVYVAEDGSLRRIDSLEKFEPSADHRLDKTITDLNEIAEILRAIYGNPPLTDKPN